MKALTFIQPWATAVVFHAKNVENRPWPPPAYILGHRIAVHAGKKLDKHDAWALRQQLPELPEPLPSGQVIGTVRVLGFVRFGENAEMLDNVGLTADQVETVVESRWRARGTKACWLLADPIPLATPVPCLGALGLWNLPESIEAKVAQQMRQRGQRKAIAS